MLNTGETWKAMWIDGENPRDSHVAFRGWVSAAFAVHATIEVFSSCPFLLYLNGVWIGEGPPRWSESRPEFQVFKGELRAGANVVAIHGHYEGVDTRMMAAMTPFLAVKVLTGTDQLPVEWRATLLPGYASGFRRINPQFGWIDWQDTRQTPTDWLAISLDDVGWKLPKAVKGPTVIPQKTEISFPHARLMDLKAVNHGVFTEQFGYDTDEPQAQFFLRDLDTHHGPPQGVWRRYDLGRVRLGRPKFNLDLPVGALVAFAQSENLQHNRVTPWITLSAGPSCNLDRYVARGGPQEFVPSTVKAGRYLEVHVIADPKKVHFLSEKFAERSYHGALEGGFHSSDARLDRIWSTGIDTYRACSEDSVIDNPTRERGEWIGDSLTVGLENAAAAFSDLKLFRKAIRQAADCARSDGLVAGLCPGTVSYLSTYACHWVSAVFRIYQLTGDFEFLREIFPAARHNMAAFSAKLTDAGLSGDLGWAFIDWGYVASDGPSEMGLNLVYLGALRSMLEWCRALGEDESAYVRDLIRVEAAIRRYFDIELKHPNPWPSIGLQRAVLGLRVGMIDAGHLSACIEFIKAHYRSCFPNDPFAPHLSDPSTAQPRLITPFFSHFALSALWEHGEGDFVLDQYRSCWGWALDQGLTTWPEVFDLRWSHCHQWSGCPTWQLSRYVLGLNPRQDLGRLTFDFSPKPTSLPSASGTLPIAVSNHSVKVDYRRDGSKSTWAIEPTTPIRIRIGSRFEDVHDRFVYEIP